MSKLARQLKREATANPKKAGILGLLLLVAVWFWSPLVWGWLKPDATDDVAVADRVEAPTVPVESEPAKTEATVEGAGKKLVHPWNRVADAIDGDPRMVAATHLPERVHPFNPVAPPVIEAASTSEEQGETGQMLPERIAQGELDPERLGLAVSSTMVGTVSRAALIQGRSYQLGDTVEVDYHGQAIGFKIVEIHEHGVVLGRGKKTYAIRLPERALSGRLELTVLEGDH